MDCHVCARLLAPDMALLIENFGRRSSNSQPTFPYPIYCIHCHDNNTISIWTHRDGKSGLHQEQEFFIPTWALLRVFRLWRPLVVSFLSARSLWYIISPLLVDLFDQSLYTDKVQSIYLSISLFICLSQYGYACTKIIEFYEEATNLGHSLDIKLSA